LSGEGTARSIHGHSRSSTLSVAGRRPPPRMMHVTELVREEMGDRTPEVIPEKLIPALELRSRCGSRGDGNPPHARKDPVEPIAAVFGYAVH